MMVPLKAAVVLAMATLISMQRVQESTLLVTLVEWSVPTLECIVILPQEEEDGLSFKEDKMEMLSSLTESE